MNLLSPLFGIAIALSVQNSFAKSRLTDPVKIARECKSDIISFARKFDPVSSV